MVESEAETGSSSFNLSHEFVSEVDVPECEDYNSLTTSGVICHCKNKILRPYLRLLAVMGLRSFGTYEPYSSKMRLIFSYLHLSQVMLFMILGYILQYMTCFRRDRGFCYKTDVADTEYGKMCHGSIVYSYVVPNLIHFSGYLYALYLFRIRESERLENLMERTFLLSSHRTDGPKKQQILVRNLWIFILLGIAWMIASVSSVMALVNSGEVTVQWIYSEKYKKVLKAILIISTLWHDMVQATIITSYCLQIQFLSSSSNSLRAKLLQHTMSSLSWIREINEYQNFLHYLNNEFAPAVCMFIITDISWSLSGVIWLFRLDSVEADEQPIGAANILVTCLWTVAGIAPFVMAALLTAACNILRQSGHEVRTRPYVYRDTPGEDLNTILLYTSTLKMKCKLFSLPVSGRYLIFFIAVSAIAILILGQCHFLKL